MEGQGGEGDRISQILADQLTLFQLEGVGILCLPHYYSPPRIFISSYGPAILPSGKQARVTLNENAHPTKSATFKSSKKWHG